MQPIGRKQSSGHSVQQLSLPAATDDRCANFSASTCPTQLLELIASSTADKLPLEKFHRLLDLAFWGGETSKNINTVSNSLYPFWVILLDIYLFIFYIFYILYRVSPHPVACGALNLKCAAGGGRATLSCPPPAHDSHRIFSAPSKD
jgi:hypothetical protein